MAVFVEVVAGGSLATAAERLGMSPTMAGKHLNSLEASLGVTLLHRTTRRHRLTEAGALYLERCRDILARVAAAGDAASSLRGEPVGLLRIGAPQSFGITRLASALPGFLRRYPGVRVELVLADASIDMLRDGLDVAFCVGPLADSSLVARRLPAFYQMVVCAAPSYLAERGVPATPLDLLSHDCLGHTRWGPRYPWTFHAPDGPVEVPVTYKLRIDSGLALREAALAGGGVILQPLSLVKDDLESGRLVKLFADFQLRGRDLYLLYARDPSSPMKVQAFIDFALTYFSELSPGGGASEGS